MLDVDPQYIKQARRLIAQGASEASAAETLMMHGVSALEANRCANQAMDEHTRLAGYQKQSMIALAIGLFGTVIAFAAGQAGDITTKALIVGPPLMTLGAFGWVLSTFFGGLALWLVKRPFVIVVAVVLISIPIIAAVVMVVMR